VENVPTAFDATRQTFNPFVELSGLDAFDAATPARAKNKSEGGLTCDASRLPK